MIEWLKVGRHWTRVLSLGPQSPFGAQTPTDANAPLVLLIPGNPGIDVFYKDFGVHLLNELPTGASFWCVSHANHVEVPDEHRQEKGYSSGVVKLDEQIAHKLDFIQKFVSPTTRLMLVGHSIGCYVILSLLQRLLAAGFGVDRAVLLFPTVERMADTPNGRRFTRLHALGAHLLLEALAFALAWLPVRAKKWLIRLHEGDSSEHLVDGALDFLRVGSVRNCLGMAHDEMLSVRRLDERLVSNSYTHKLTFYYGLDDAWCPVDFGDDMRRRVGDERVVFCDAGCAHAFVISHSDTMARKVGAILTG